MREKIIKIKWYIMNNLLVGNGINIQFNKTDYTSQQIVLRILKNCDRDNFPSHIIVNFPYLLKNYIGQLYLESRKIILGDYDNYTFGYAEKNSLVSLKKQYTDKINMLRITDIGFEDYYLIHDLVCHKMKVYNLEQFYIRESMKVAYLYSLYNDGKINQLYKNYPRLFIEFLLKFDNIFTTNYDSNIELATEKEIFHHHLNLSQDSGLETPEGSFAASEITDAINSFSDEYRVPFSMHVAGYKYNEIAEKMSLPLGTVKSRIFFARKKLQEQFADYR